MSVSEPLGAVTGLDRLPAGYLCYYRHFITMAGLEYVQNHITTAAGQR